MDGYMQTQYCYNSIYLDAKTDGGDWSVGRTLKTKGTLVHTHKHCSTGPRVGNMIWCLEGWEANIIVIISRLFSTFSKRAYLEPLESLSASVSGRINYTLAGAGLCV